MSIRSGVINIDSIYSDLGLNHPITQARPGMFSRRNRDWTEFPLVPLARVNYTLKHACKSTKILGRLCRWTRASLFAKPGGSDLLYFTRCPPKTLRCAVSKPHSPPSSSSFSSQSHSTSRCLGRVVTQVDQDSCRGLLVHCNPVRSCKAHHSCLEAAVTCLLSAAIVSAVFTAEGS